MAADEQEKLQKEIKKLSQLIKLHEQEKVHFNDV